MTVQEVINRARKRLQDTNDQSYRWDDTELILYIDDGHSMMLRERPEIHKDYENSGAMVAPRPITVLNDLANVIDIQDRHANALASFIEAQALRNDTLDAQNAQRSSNAQSVTEGELRSK